MIQFPSLLSSLPPTTPHLFHSAVDILASLLFPTHKQSHLLLLPGTMLISHILAWFAPSLQVLNIILPESFSCHPLQVATLYTPNTLLIPFPCLFFSHSTYHIWHIKYCFLLTLPYYMKVETCLFFGFFHLHCSRFSSYWKDIWHISTQ